MEHETAELLGAYARRMGLPIVGVVIGRSDDRSMWRLDFAADATQADRDKAADIIRDLDIDAETLIANDAFVDRKLDNPVIAALITVMAAQTTHTAAELRALVKTQLTDQ